MLDGFALGFDVPPLGFSGVEADLEGGEADLEAGVESGVELPLPNRCNSRENLLDDFEPRFEGSPLGFSNSGADLSGVFDSGIERPPPARGNDNLDGPDCEADPRVRVEGVLVVDRGPRVAIEMMRRGGVGGDCSDFLELLL